jgi:putative oxidoreductase
MLVAWITNHRGNGFFIFRPGEGWEYVMTLTVVGVVIGILGPGRWSLDDVAGLLGLGGWTGWWIVLALGGGGAALLLAGFWRPPVKAPAAE